MTGQRLYTKFLMVLVVLFASTSSTEPSTSKLTVQAIGGWVASSSVERWVAKYGDGWLLARLVARLLATAALWVRIQTSLKKIQNGRHKQRSCDHTLACQKIYKNGPGLHCGHFICIYLQLHWGWQLHIQPTILHYTAWTMSTMFPVAPGNKPDAIIWEKDKSIN